MIKTIIVKNSWKDVMIDDYLKLKDLENIETNIEIFKILTNIEDLDGINVQTLQDISKEFMFTNEMPKISDVNYKRIQIGTKTFESTIDINKLKTIQYIDIQHFINNSVENISDIMSIVLVPVGKEYEEYDSELSEYLRYNLDIELALDLRNKLEKLLVIYSDTFSGLFLQEEDEDDIEIEDDEEEKEDEETTFNKKWGWVLLGEQVKDVIGENLNYVWNMKAIEFLNYCTYLRDKRVNNDEQIKKYKQQ